MAIYTQKWGQKWLKSNNRGEGGEGGIKMSWVGKNRKINNPWWDDYSVLESISFWNSGPTYHSAGVAILFIENF